MESDTPDWGGGGGGGGARGGGGGGGWQPCSVIHCSVI